MAGLAPFFNVQFFDSEGLPAADYLLYTYVSGTTTPKGSYTNQAASASNTNPIELDADGRCSLWLADDEEYSIELHTPADALVKRWDDIAAIPVLDVGSYVPLAGGVTMTGRFNLAGAAQASLQPVTLQQLTDAVATGTSGSATAAALAAEAAARTAADATHTAAIAAETAARIAAIAAITTTVGGINPSAAAAPIGSIIMWFHGALPSGYLACEGGVGNRTTHAALFALWSTSFGNGDGSLTFGLPDFRGYFPRGWDNTAGVDPGRALGSTQADEIKAHTHSITITDTDLNGPLVANASSGVNTTGATASTGGTETRPKNLAVRFLVKAV